MTAPMTNGFLMFEVPRFLASRVQGTERHYLMSVWFPGVVRLDRKILWRPQNAWTRLGSRRRVHKTAWSGWGVTMRRTDLRSQPASPSRDNVELRQAPGREGAAPSKPGTQQGRTPANAAEFLKIQSAQRKPCVLASFEELPPFANCSDAQVDSQAALSPKSNVLRPHALSGGGSARSAIASEFCRREKNTLLRLGILGSEATRRAEEKRARPVMLSHGQARRTRCATFRCDRSGGGYW